MRRETLITSDVLSVLSFDPLIVYLWPLWLLTQLEDM